MFYEYPLIIPASTTQAAPVTSEIQIVKGVISYVEVVFPDGCNNLVHAHIIRGLHQVWPTPPAVSFSDNNFHIGFKEDFPITEPPFILKLTGWSNDDYYPHTIRFRFQLNMQPILQQSIIDDILFGTLPPESEMN